MRIGLSTSVVHQDFCDGHLKYIQMLMVNLAKIDTVNDYLLFIPRLHFKYFNIKNDNIKIITIPLIFCSPLGSIIWHLFIYQLCIIYYRIDIVHLPEYRRPLIFAPCKVIMTVHDLIGFNVKGHFLSRGREYFHKIILKILQLTVKNYIAVSQNTKNDILKYINADKESIKVIYEGVAPVFRHRQREEISTHIYQQYQIPDTFLLCVARLEHPLKNHATLVKALRILKDSDVRIPCVFAGRFSRRHEHVLNIIQQLDMEKDIHLTGYVLAEDLPLFYNAAELVIYPSLYEGFGFPVLEAYASGVPIICSKSASLPELACNDEMLFDPFNEYELAEKIIKFTSDQAVRSKQIALQNEKLNKFSWENTARETLREYQNLVLK